MDSPVVPGQFERCRLLLHLVRERFIENSGMNSSIRRRLPERLLIRRQAQYPLGESITSQLWSSGFPSLTVGIPISGAQWLIFRLGKSVSAKSHPSSEKYGHLIFHLSLVLSFPCHRSSVYATSGYCRLIAVDVASCLLFLGEFLVWPVCRLEGLNVAPGKSKMSGGDLSVGIQ